MKKQTTPEKRQQWFNWNGVIIGIFILVLLNSLLFPYVGKSEIKDADYITFISQLDKGKVSKVVIKDGYIYYDILSPKDKNTDKTSKTYNPFSQQQSTVQTYRTSEVNDPQLVTRLLNAKAPTKTGKIELSKEVPQKNSPLVDFFIWWILPGLIFWWIWRAGTNKMMKGVGGGASFLSIGKSGAKVYAEREVKTRFEDVAGQDEAKATLMELVDFLHNPKNIHLLAPVCQRALFSSVPQERERRSLPELSPVRLMCHSSQSAVQNSYRCSLAWVPQKSVTSSTRLLRKLLVSSSSMRSTLSARAEIRLWEMMRENRH